MIKVNEKYMKYALTLAKRGVGKVNPNPLVGAVLVKAGKIIGEGYHEFYGGAHAEINALKSASESVDGATLYVTLEPCSHYGKTPPCIEAIIKSKIAKVIIGSLDPNPLVSGKGVLCLKEAGVKVVTGVLEEECKKLNEVFMKYIVKKEPFVVLKSAMSLDGKIATVTGESKWITSEVARHEVHQLRNAFSGIMVGVETVIKDDPQLTCRILNGRNPIIIVVDSRLRIPMTSKILTGESKVIVATTKQAEESKVSHLQELGISVLILESHKGRVDLKQLMKQLGQLGIDSILLEGGASLNDSALKAGIVDKVQFYIAPKIIGGEKAKTPIGGVGIEHLEDAIQIKDLKMQVIGEEIVLEGYIERK